MQSNTLALRYIFLKRKKFFNCVLTRSNKKVNHMSEASLAASGQNQLQSAMHKDCSDSSKNMNDMAEQLFSKYGVQNVLQSVTNAAADYVKKELAALIDDMAMPQFMKDDAMQQVNNIGNSYQTDTPQGAQDGVNQVLGGSSSNSNGSSNGSSSAGSSNGSSSSGSSSSGSSSSGSSSSADDVMKGTMDMLRSAMQEETEGSTSGSGTSGGKGNWLAVLARALGQTAGKHLKSMVELGNKMGGIDSKENPEEFAKIQAEFQAEAQIFKMFQEAIGTMIKSIGEGMASVARKQ